MLVVLLGVVYLRSHLEFMRSEAAHKFRNAEVISHRAVCNAGFGHQAVALEAGVRLYRVGEDARVEALEVELLRHGLVGLAGTALEPGGRLVLAAEVVVVLFARHKAYMHFGCCRCQRRGKIGHGQDGPLFMRGIACHAVAPFLAEYAGISGRHAARYRLLLFRT